MNGGPSHVDTFDPKPALDRSTRANRSHRTCRPSGRPGPAFGSPFKFQKYGQSGIEVSELFAKTARVHRRHLRDPFDARRRAQPRAVAHAHELRRGPAGRPSVGSWVLYGLGTENQNLPGFIVMCPGGYPIAETQNWQSAFLPGVYQGTYIDSQHTDIEKLIENIKNRYVVAPPSSARSSTCCMQLNQRTPGAAPARGRARGADPVVRAGLPDADRGGATPSTSSQEPAARSATSTARASRRGSS